MKFCPVIPFPQIKALVRVNQQPRLCTVVGWLGHSRCVVVLDGPRQGRKEVDRRDLALLPSDYDVDDDFGGRVA